MAPIWRVEITVTGGPWRDANQDTDDAKNASPCLTQKAPYKGLSADSGEKHEPASDIDAAVVDSLKALDPNRPIREADITKLRLTTDGLTSYYAASRADLQCAPFNESHRAAAIRVM